MKELSQISAELDEIHAQARDAFERRDLARYRELFAPGLKYQQADGRVIDRQRLMSDVAAQFRRLSWSRSSFVREHIEIGEDRATEVLNQTVAAGVTVFFLIHRTWHLTRQSRFIWREDAGQWRIEEAHVLEERVSSGHFHVGFRAPVDACPDV
jgi:hypothetical protein